MTRALLGGMPALLALAPEDRPRERLLSRGAASLSDAELLAILLGSGRQGQNVVEIAHDLLAHAGDLRGVAESAEAELCALPGVGPARAAVIQAAIELGRRVTGVSARARPVSGQCRRCLDALPGSLGGLAGRGILDAGPRRPPSGLARIVRRARLADRGRSPPTRRLPHPDSRRRCFGHLLPQPPFRGSNAVTPGS